MGINLLGVEQCSASGDAVRVTTYADDFTTRGNSFLFEKNISIATGDTALVLWDYTTFAPIPGKEIGQIYVYAPSFQSTAGPVTVNLYRGTNYSGGTEFDANNPNTMAIKTTSGTTLTLGPTGTVKGTLSMQYLVGGQSQGNQSAGASVTTRRSVLAIRPKATFNSIVNRGRIEIDDISILVGSANVYWEIVYGGALGGVPSWGTAGANSLAEFAVSGTTVTGGR